MKVMKRSLYVLIISGHGVCDQESRQCYCEAFWMQDLIQKYLGDGESNCGKFICLMFK